MQHTVARPASCFRPVHILETRARYRQGVTTVTWLPRDRTNPMPHQFGATDNGQVCVMLRERANGCSTGVRRRRRTVLWERSARSSRIARSMLRKDSMHRFSGRSVSMDATQVLSGKANRSPNRGRH